jgi:dihydrofolate synthase / folylpolyglutamate synthase
MNYAEAIRFLYELRMFGTKLGLEKTFQLAALAGNPQDRLKFIHVAGTNGKGSTCAMLESIYRAAGLRTGLFTSPHLVTFRERIQVNRSPISREDVCRLVTGLREMMKRLDTPEPPTFFEAVTIMALQYFAEAGCDIVIWETGMGGRLDATNIVRPVVSVITNVALDHQQWLGQTLREIAFEKSGIIKQGVPVVTAAEEAGVLETISAVAQNNHAMLHRVTRDDGEKIGNEFSIGLPGTHQRLNAATAAAAVWEARNQLPIDTVAIRRGLASVTWPGRFQSIRDTAGRTFMVDGAHNPAAMSVLAELLCQQTRPETLTVILGVLQDKNWQEMCRILAPLANNFVLVPVQSERTSDPSKLAAAVVAANSRAGVKTATSLAHALPLTSNAKSILITGSLYLAGEALELLQPDLYPDSERELNELGTSGVSVPQTFQAGTS